jgi:phenylacetate-CoA ligase
VSTWCGTTELRRMAEHLVAMVPELTDDTILLNRFPLFAPASFAFEEALRMAGACHVAAGTMTWDVPFPRALDFIRRLGVTTLASLPLEPILLREVALEQGLDPLECAAALRVVFCGGAVLPPALRRLIESDWGVRVVEIYGSNETLGLGIGCVAGRLHLCTDMVECEVLDAATLQPVGPSEPGVLTVTSLIHEVMPLLRYFTGDLVRMHDDACACGDPRPTADVLGRFDDVVELAGARILSYDLLDAVYEFADRCGTRIFFVLVRPRTLHVRIEVANADAAAHRDAEHRLRERLGVPVLVEYLGHNEVLDRNALFRGPKIYKPSLVADWRTEGRKPLTIMEALLEWPRFDARTLWQIVRRQFVNRGRRKRILRDDARDDAPARPS